MNINLMACMQEKGCGIMLTDNNRRDIRDRLRKAYPELDDFAANELVYIAEHIDRLDISLIDVCEALCCAYDLRRTMNG